MPNIKSAKKRLKQNEGRRLLNSARKSLVRTERRKLFEAIAEGDAESQAKRYASFCSALDKAAKHGVIKKNNATRRKTRAAEAIRVAQAAPAAS
ncbi:MAG: small subunit ribosomal protein S20 [Kiritimatiellia bacterium]|jgi:small subunit ribosomal protein S20